MTWNAFHHRGEILQTVVEAADRRRDGMLPMHLPGVSETFRDELDLLAALHLKWHARLSGNIERQLMAQPLDLEDAIAHAWSRTSEELPGIRLIIDRYSEFPSGPEMAAALTKANDKEWVGLAAAAGLANDGSSRAARAGRRVATKGRAVADGSSTDAAAPGSTSSDEAVAPSLVERIRAVLAA